MGSAPHCYSVMQGAYLHAAHLQPPTSSDAAISHILQEQEQAWSRHAAAPAQAPAPAGPSEQQYYTWLAQSGATTQYTPRRWSNYADSSELGSQRLQQRVALYGLHEQQIYGDGNCQFRALADQLYGDQRCHAAVRRAVVWQMANQPQLYHNHVPEDYRRYLQRMARPGEWGDHVSLAAAADVFGVRIMVLTSYAGDTPFIDIQPRALRSNRVLYLSYKAEAHYNSLWPRRSKHPSQKKILGSKKLHKLVQVLF